MSRRNIAILPDSTGKSIGIKHYVEIGYIGAASTNTFAVGDTVVGQSSSTIGTINQVIPATVATGTIVITLSPNNLDASFTSGENLQVGGSTKAQISSISDAYIQKNTTVSYNNPDFGQIIDRYGAASTKYLEGHPTLDSFSKIRVSNGTILGAYNFNYDDLGSLFGSVTVGTGTVAFESGSGAMNLANNTLSGAYGSYTSNLNHKYFIGQSQLTNLAIALSEDGKTNSRRRWGYYDDNDGFFFESNGTQKNLVIRSSLNGTVTETVISQSSWNLDTADGSHSAENPSDMQLDFSKTNMYWIDFQWPIGNVRFGLECDGQRLELHRYSSPNNDTVPLTRRSALPIRVENENLDATASTSELRLYSAGVWTEGKFNEATTVRQSHSYTSGSKPITDEETYIYAFRPKLEMDNQSNKTIALLKEYKVCALTGSAGDDAVVKINFWLNPVLVGSTFAVPKPYGRLEVDEDATTHIGFIKIGEYYVRGTETIELPNNYSGVDRLGVKSDGTQPTMSITVQSLVSGSTVDFYGNLVWKEVVD